MNESYQYEKFHVFVCIFILIDRFYIGQIMGFITYKTNVTNPERISVKICWYWRSKDVYVHNTERRDDPRLVVCTMQTDLNKVSDIRGHCNVKLFSEIEDIESYRKGPDNFYFLNIYNIWTRRLFDIVSPNEVKNLPEPIKLYAKKYPHYLVEYGRRDDFINGKFCAKCLGWCDISDNIYDCPKCSHTYHRPCINLSYRVEYSGLKGPSAYEESEHNPRLLESPVNNLCIYCNESGREDDRMLLHPELINPMANIEPLASEIVRSPEKVSMLAPLYNELSQEKVESSTAASTVNGDDDNDFENNNIGENAGVEADGDGNQVTGEETEEELRDEENNDEPLRVKLENSSSFDSIDTYSTLNNTNVESLPPAQDSQSSKLSSASNDEMGDKAKQESRTSTIDATTTPSYPTSPKTENKDDNKHKPKPNLPKKIEYPFIYLGRNADYISMIRHGDGRLVDNSYLPSMRVGPKFHADLSFLLEDQEQVRTREPSKRIINKRAKSNEVPSSEDDANYFPSDYMKFNNPNNAAGHTVNGVNGNETDVDIVFRIPNVEARNKINEYLDKILHLLPHSVRTADIRNTDRFINKAMWKLHEYDYDYARAEETMKSIKPIDVGIVTWTDAEVNAFEELAAQYKDELNPYGKGIPTRTMKEIVEYYYKWYPTRKAAPILSKYEDNTKKSYATQSLYISGGKPLKTSSNANNLVITESLLPQSTDQGERHWQHCHNCKTINDTIWRVLIISGSTNTYCTSCGTEWLKHGYLPVIADKVKQDNVNEAEELLSKQPNRRKRVVSYESDDPSNYNDKFSDTNSNPSGYNAFKRPKFDFNTASEAYFTISDEELEEVETLVCSICQCEQLPIKSVSMLTCKDCKLSVHTYCYGSEGIKDENDFSCYRCRNMHEAKYSHNYQCIMCPIKQTKQSSAIQPTIGSNWIHSSCALWLPKLSLISSQQDKLIAGMGLIKEENYKSICSFCNQSQGACILCAECNFPSHVTCAQYAGLDLYIDLDTNEPKFHCNRHDSRPHLPFRVNFGKLSSSIGTKKMKLLPKVDVFNKDDSKSYLRYRSEKEINANSLKDYLIAKDSLYQSKNIGIGEKKAYSTGIESVCHCHE